MLLRDNVREYLNVIYLDFNSEKMTVLRLSIQHQNICQNPGLRINGEEFFSVASERKYLLRILSFIRICRSHCEDAGAGENILCNTLSVQMLRAERRRVVLIQDLNINSASRHEAAISDQNFQSILIKLLAIQGSGNIEFTILFDQELAVRVTLSDEVVDGVEEAGVVVRGVELEDDGSRQSSFIHGGRVKSLTELWRIVINIHQLDPHPGLRCVLLLTIV